MFNQWMHCEHLKYVCSRSAFTMILLHLFIALGITIISYGWAPFVLLLENKPNNFMYLQHLLVSHYEYN